MSERSRPDFVRVRLTDYGRKMATATGGTTVRTVAGATHEMEIAVGETKEVTRDLEWERWLSQTYLDGQPLFELAPDDGEAAPAPAADSANDEEHRG